MLLRLVRLHQRRLDRGGPSDRGTAVTVIDTQPRTCAAQGRGSASSVPNYHVA